MELFGNTNFEYFKCYNIIINQKYSVLNILNYISLVLNVMNIILTIYFNVFQKKAIIKQLKNEFIGSHPPVKKFNK